MSRVKRIITFLVILAVCSSELLLHNIPFEFQLAGPISYTPTSGGINIPGYKLRIGYTSHQWIGVKFMTLTSNLNYDILIFKRSTTSNAGMYECSVSDYYVSEGRQENLMADTINNMDKQVTSQSDSNHFYLEMYRTKGNTTGEDWQGGDFVDICFFTSDQIFNKDNWKAQYQTCYGFAITDYTSKWLGYQINKNVMFDGVQSKIYGGVSGPLLRFQMYVFRPNPILSGNQITIRIGNKISSQVGYDYQKCLTNKGDFFGPSATSLSSDLSYSGYNDTSCSVTKTASYMLLSFLRYPNTHDQFDQKIGKNTNFCFLVGENQNCYDIAPQILFPKMTIESAIKVYGQRLMAGVGLMILILLWF